MSCITAMNNLVESLAAGRVPFLVFGIAAGGSLGALLAVEERRRCSFCSGVAGNHGEEDCPLRLSIREVLGL